MKELEESLNEMLDYWYGKTKYGKKDLCSLIQLLGNIIIVQNEIISRLVLSG
jgi:hypothetical protein